MDTKAWWQSKAIIGGAIAIGSAVAGGFGIIIDPDTQVQIQDYILVITTAASGLLAIYGRIKADRKIKGR